MKVAQNIANNSEQCEMEEIVCSFSDHSKLAALIIITLPCAQMHSYDALDKQNKSSNNLWCILDFLWEI